MTDQTTASSTDKPLNGAALVPPAPVSTPAPAPATAATSRLPTSATRTAAAERLLDRDPAFEGMSRFTASSATAAVTDVKLQSTTRVVNAFIGYLTSACGRQADQLSEADVAALGNMLGIMERLEVTKGRNGH